MALGQHLASDDAVSDQQFKRAMAFWDWRIETASGQPIDVESELPSFGWWLPPGKNRTGQYLERLLSTVQSTGGRTEGLFMLLPRLADLAREYPLETVKILSETAGAINPLELSAIRDPIREILSTARDSGGDPAAKGRQANQRFIQAGIHDFRDLFRSA